MTLETKYFCLYLIFFVAHPSIKLDFPSAVIVLSFPAYIIITKKQEVLHGRSDTK